MKELFRFIKDTVLIVYSLIMFMLGFGLGYEIFRNDKNKRKVNSEAIGFDVDDEVQHDRVMGFR